EPCHAPPWPSSRRDTSLLLRSRARECRIVRCLALARLLPIASGRTPLCTVLHRLDGFVRRPHCVRQIGVVDQRGRIIVAPGWMLWRGRRIFRDGYFEPLLHGDGYPRHAGVILPLTVDNLTVGSSAHGLRDVAREQKRCHLSP